MSILPLILLLGIIPTIIESRHFSGIRSNHRTGVSESFGHAQPLRHRRIRVRPFPIRSAQLLKRVRPTQIRRSRTRIRLPVREGISARAMQVHSPKSKNSRVILAPSRRNMNMRKLRSNVVNNQKFSRQNVIIADTANINSRVGFQNTGGSMNRRGTFDRFIDRLTDSVIPSRRSGNSHLNFQTRVQNRRRPIGDTGKFTSSKHHSGMPIIGIDKNFHDHDAMAQILPTPNMNPLLPTSNRKQVLPTSNKNPVHSPSNFNSVDPSAIINPIETSAIMNHVEPSAIMNTAHSAAMTNVSPVQPSAIMDPALSPGLMGMPIPIGEANTELGDANGLLDHFGMAFMNNPLTLNATKNNNPSHSSKSSHNSKSSHSVNHDIPPDPLAHLLKPEVIAHPRQADIFGSMSNGHLVNSNPDSFQTDAAKNASTDVLNMMGTLSLPKSISNDIIQSLLFDPHSNGLPLDTNPNSKLSGNHNNVYKQMRLHTHNNNPFKEFRH